MELLSPVILGGALDRSDNNNPGYEIFGIRSWSCRNLLHPPSWTKLDPRGLTCKQEMPLTLYKLRTHNFGIQKSVLPSHAAPRVKWCQKWWDHLPAVAAKKILEKSKDFPSQERLIFIYIDREYPSWVSMHWEGPLHTSGT